MVFHETNLGYFDAIGVLNALDFSEGVEVVCDHLDGVSRQQPQVVEIVAQDDEVAIVRVGEEFFQFAAVEVENLDMVLLFGHVSTSHHEAHLVGLQVDNVDVVWPEFLENVDRLVFEECFLIGQGGLHLPFAVHLRLVENRHVSGLVLDVLCKLGVRIS